MKLRGLKSIPLTVRKIHTLTVIVTIYVDLIEAKVSHIADDIFLGVVGNTIPKVMNNLIGRLT